MVGKRHAFGLKHRMKTVEVSSTLMKPSSGDMLAPPEQMAWSGHGKHRDGEVMFVKIE